MGDNGVASGMGTSSTHAGSADGWSMSRASSSNPAPSVPFRETKTSSLMSGGASDRTSVPDSTNTGAPDGALYTTGPAGEEKTNDPEPKCSPSFRIVASPSRYGSRRSSPSNSASRYVKLIAAAGTEKFSSTMKLGPPAFVSLPGRVSGPNRFW